MRFERWLFLPFLGGRDDNAGGPEHHHGTDGGAGGGQKYSKDAGLPSKHESVKDFANKKEEDIVQDYNAPIRWWVIATLFPLVAGTFGPIANAFNICAVAIDWRLIVSSGDTESEGTHITDPRWLVAVNAVSLAIALVANFALLAHMTGRMRFNISAPIVIVGWYISGFLDIALVAAAHRFVPLPDNPNATYSQAYYYAAFSGIIYVLLSMLLSITACGVWILHYSSEFKLSMAQRSLMLQTMLFLSYVLIAGAVYSTIEDWVYLDAVYYVVVTLFTIGFGDFTPKTHLGRSLYFPMAVGGIIFVGLIIANTRTLVLESVSVKVSTRLVEKARFKALKSGNPAEGIVKLRGVARRDTNAPTEIERRRKEFEVMREIQRAAAHNNRLLTLFMATMAFMILWFVGAVVFWQGEKATGGQNWTYFEAVYFTYTAQLTIGYGDFEPQTNSSKPAFVFWSLIALPTLTVLIGAVGDTVTDFVDWAICWFGKHAPDLAKLVRGLGGSHEKEKAMRDVIKELQAEDEPPPENFDSIANVEKGKIVPADMSENVFAEYISLDLAQDAYVPHIKLQVAQKIVSHLDQSPPRKYTFEEWTFLLRLLGEDESSEDGHRRIGRPLPNGHEIATPVREHPKQVWSWMGQESPLMTLEDDSEPKWVLNKLMHVLERDLKQRGDRHIERETGEPVPSEKEEPSS